MNTEKRTIKREMDSNQFTKIEDISYLLSVFIGGTLEKFTYHIRKSQIRWKYWDGL